MISLTLDYNRKNRVTLTARRGDDLVLCETISPGNSKQVREVAARLGYDPLLLTDACLKQLPSVEIAEETLMRVEDPFLVRKVHETSDTAIKYATFDEAIRNPIPDGVISWKDRTQTCCLDIDYHTVKPPDGEWLLASLRRIQPQPTYYWLSKNGGAHLIYQVLGSLSAEELAAVAAISWKSIDHLAVTELLTVTRFPPAQCFSQTPTSDLSAVARFLGTEVSEKARDDYLTENNFALAEAVEHERCPVAPGASHGKPVFPTEHGIVCHSCRAAGRCYGSKSPGFFPYSALIGGGPSNLIRAMAQRFCHWEHAKIVLEDRLKLSGDTARLCWQAMLHLIHGEDPRVGRAMQAGRNLIRLDRRWTTRDGLATYTKDIAGIISALPACQNKEGTAVAEQVTRFLQPIDLDEEGYPTVSTISGIRIYSHHLSLPDEKITVVTPNSALRSPTMAARRPRYVPVEKRMADPWAVIEEAFPKIDRNYLQLLIAAKGAVEGQSGMPPMLMVAGVSESGKTSTPHIAAAMTGDKCTEVVWQANSARFRQEYATAVETSSFVAINEILKEADRAGSDALSAMDVFLNFTPDSISHKMYVGALPLGRLPATIVTEVTIPQSIRNDKQIARRFIYVELQGSRKWDESMIAADIRSFDRLRLADEKFCDASNAIVSEVIDRFFVEPRTLIDIAAELGYNTLDKAEGFADPLEELKAFYRAWELRTPSTEDRWKGGWRVFRFDEESEIARLWGILCDGNTTEKRKESRRMKSQDWSPLIGKPLTPVFRANGNTMGVNFVENKS